MIYDVYYLTEFAVYSWLVRMGAFRVGLVILTADYTA